MKSPTVPKLQNTATATPEDLVVHAKTQLLDGVAWTVPTLVGPILYARDLGQILAIDVS